MKKKRGRKRKHPEVVVPPPRCPRCGSGKRSAVLRSVTQFHRGLRDEYPYTRIVRRYVECTDCGQRYVWISHE